MKKWIFAGHPGWAITQGWDLPAVHEIGLSVHNAGCDVLPITVIELYQP